MYADSFWSNNRYNSKLLLKITPLYTQSYMSRIWENSGFGENIHKCDIQKEKVFNMREERAEASKLEHIAVMFSVSAVMELYIRHLLAILHKWPNLFESHWKKTYSDKNEKKYQTRYFDQECDSFFVNVSVCLGLPVISVLLVTLVTIPLTLNT